MSQKAFSLTTGVVFLLIAVGHLLRLIFGWEAVIAGGGVPMWASWIAFVVAGYLAYEGLRLSRKT